MRQVSRGIGLVAAQGVLGLGSYAILVAAGRSLDAGQFAAFTVFWSVSVSLGLGLFGPLEVMLFRLAAQRTHAADEVEIPRLNRWYLAIGAVCALAAAVFLRYTVDVGTPTAWALAIAVAGYFFVLRVQAIQRGESAGRGAYGRYARQVGADGSARLILSAVLLAVSVAGAATITGWSANAATWAAAVVAAGILGAWAGRGTGVPRSHLDADSPPASPASAAVRDILVLSAGTTLSVVLANSLPSVAATMSLSGVALATFSSYVLVARVPLFFSGLGAAVIIPRISAAAADPPRLRSQILAALAFSTLAGVVAGLAMAVLTAPIVAVAFASAGPVPPGFVGLIAFSTGALIVALLGQGIAIGSGHTGYVAYIWTGALVVFAASLLALSGPTEMRIAGASAISSAAACLALGHTAYLLLRGTTAGVPEADSRTTIG